MVSKQKTLMMGVEVDGIIHYDFDVRLPVIRDTVAALQVTAEKFGTTEGEAAGMYYRVAVVASVLTQLGSVPKEAITADLLLDSLTDGDYDMIDSAIVDIKKKRLLLKSNSTTIEKSFLSSAATASVNNE